MTERRRQHERRKSVVTGLWAIGLIGCAASLVLGLLGWRASLAGWLAAFTFWSSVPIGALGLVIMMRLVPGVWVEKLYPGARSAAMLMPLAALAVVPLLVGFHALYDWAGKDQSGFRGAYLSGWFFDLRSVLFFACLGLLCIPLLRPRGDGAVGSAALGAILLVLLELGVTTDWLMSLSSDFHSTAFALYVMSIQASIALMLVAGARLLLEEPGKPVPVLGALILTCSLLWAYFAYVEFFVIWSGNLPSKVKWYLDRAADHWGWAEGIIAIVPLTSILLLLFPLIRTSRPWLLGIAAATLVGKAVETAWLVIPALDRNQGLALAAAALAFVGLGALSGAIVLRMRPPEPAQTPPARAARAA